MEAWLLVPSLQSDLDIWIKVNQYPIEYELVISKKFKKNHPN